MLSVDHVSIEFASRLVLDDISFLINKRDRIALVGKNGAGKTTLLRLLVGEYMPTSGMITKSSDMVIGYLPQMMHHNNGYTLREEVMQTAPKEDQARFIAEMDKVVSGLGFTREDFDRQCSEFSGGWRMRIELAKILLQHPDLLLLDEPTNHLDIESIQWLEDFILTSQSALVTVSHDRAFIDNVTNRTIEIMLGRIYDYNVAYSKFVELRKERHEQQVRAYQNQQKMIKDTEEFIERFRYKATKAVQVQQRIKQLEKLERIEIDQEDTSRLNLRFPPAPRSGDFPLIIEDLTKSYGSHTVIHDVNMTIKRGDKVAFVGKNGEGKTTLTKCIMGEVDYLGTLKTGHNVQIGYFAQNQATFLDESKTVFQTIDDIAVGDIRTKIRDILGAFMFGGEDIDKKVKVLSGGERSRLAMIELLLKPCNFLILDEPTNHLDMQTKDILKAALKDFSGTLICVSHDRDFLAGLVDKVYEFKDGHIREYLGGIYDFLKKRQISSLQELELPTKETAVSENNLISDSKRDFLQQKAQAAAERKRLKQIADIEAEISRLEAQQKETEDLLTNPENQTQELFQQYERIKHEISKKMYEWEILND